MTLVKFQPLPTTKLSPFGLFNSLFDRNLADFVGHDGLPNFQPAVNVLETEQAFQLELAAPGFDKSEFAVRVENEHLIVEGKREAAGEPTEKQYTRREFQVAPFQRKFKLPKTVNQDAVQAVYENGVLKIALEKKVEVKPVPKTIEIA
ncbi:MAG: Hsp20/alpha crystallin family protein [Saprospiraceae bacterium]